jgi:hypothetical protein
MRTTAGQLIIEFGSDRPVSYHAIQDIVLQGRCLYIYIVLATHTFILNAEPEGRANA